jgi:anti-sigma factor (TIGR02949 family)
MSAPSCRVVRKHLDALVDGELDTTIQVEFDAHLATCSICREHAAFYRTIKQTVKEELGNAKAPERLRHRVLAALEAASAPAPGAAGKTRRPRAGPGRAREASRRRGLRVFTLPARYAIPAAAAAALVVVLSAPTDDGEADDAAVAATAVPFFDDVVRRHSSDHPVEIVGPPQQVVGWFRGKLEFPVRPVEFDRDDVRLVGGRISNVRDRDAAAFYYDVRGRRITVMVFEPPQPMTSARAWTGARRVQIRGRELYYRQVRGYTVPVVEHEGLTYAFTGDLDSRSIIQLAASARVAP